MKKKDAKGADEAFSRYMTLVGSVKPEVLAPLFRSLSKKEDIPYLEKWLSLSAIRRTFHFLRMHTSVVFRIAVDSQALSNSLRQSAKRRRR